MKYGEGIYGQVQYGSRENESSLPQAKKNLIDYLPFYYSESRAMNAVQEVISTEVNKLHNAVFDVLNQLYVDTATWGLDMWERQLGIRTDSSKPLNYRRSLIKAKLYGTQTTTVKALEKLANAFVGGESKMFEHPDESRFVLKFIDPRGIPPRMMELTQIVEQIKPAHLAFTYEYTYCVWHEARTYSWGLGRIMSWEAFRIAKPRS